MRRMIFIAGLLVISALMISGSAFAVVEELPNLYTSDAYGGAPVDGFGLLTDPIYLYADSYNLLSFTSPLETKYWTVFNNYFSGQYPDYVNPKAADGWYTLNDLRFVDVKLTGFTGLDWSSIGNYGWDDIREPGTWETTAYKLWCAKDTWNFDLAAPPSSVPEPISSTLFLLGAGALGIKAYRRKKKIS